MGLKLTEAAGPASACQCSRANRPDTESRNFYFEVVLDLGRINAREMHQYVLTRVCCLWSFLSSINSASASQALSILRNAVRFTSYVEYKLQVDCG